MSDSENKKSKSDKKQDLKGNAESKESGRRKLLKAGGVVASSYAVPEKWKKPVVDTVLLPSHAQTTATPAPTPGSVAPTPAPTTGAPTPPPTPAPTSPTPMTSAPTPAPTPA